jgi:OmpR-family two-component system manganese-sensing sensor histidine kinase
MLDLMLGIGLMIASVAGIGWLLSGIAIQPVRESYQRLKQFTADASHELRNPIATIQTNVQVALAEPDLDPEIQRQQLKVIERLTQRLGRLVNDLLFLARQDSGILQADWVLVPLDALLMEVIEEQQLMAKEKGIALSLHLVAPKFLIVDESSVIGMEEDLFTMRGDWDQLARLFTNLTSNALQYTLAGGVVKVELERIRKSSYPQLQVKIVDTGIGIPESALNQIFDRFYRGDPARTYKDKGSGLGLAIAQAIVESHQGKIQVNSVLNEGTTVIVTLPYWTS